MFLELVKTNSLHGKTELQFERLILAFPMVLVVLRQRISQNSILLTVLVGRKIEYRSATLVLWFIAYQWLNGRRRNRIPSYWSILLLCAYEVFCIHEDSVITCNTYIVIVIKHSFYFLQPGTMIEWANCW
jgi:hypothetical protein